MFLNTVLGVGFVTKGTRPVVNTTQTFCFYPENGKNEQNPTPQDQSYTVTFLIQTEYVSLMNNGVKLVSFSATTTVSLGVTAG